MPAHWPRCFNRASKTERSSCGRRSGRCSDPVTAGLGLQAFGPLIRHFSVSCTRIAYRIMARFAECSRKKREVPISC
jgi:hypothetical protein